ncbi:MAG: acyl-CoA dehydratase activase [Pseudomonadota bacterium]
MSENNFFIGIDVGTETINLLVMNEEEILYTKTEVTEEGGLVASQRILEEAVRELNLPSGDTLPIVSTGAAKKTINFALKQSTDMVCHAKGAHWYFSDAGTVIDIGASGSRVMRLNNAGRVDKFAVNAKCASGTGIYLRNMTKIIESSFEEMSDLSAGIEEGTEISNYCAVFAESEVISKIHAGEPKDRIAAGIFDAVVDRLMEQLRKVGTREEVIVTGGVARNTGLVRSLEKRIGLKAKIPPDPEITGALGAALIARGAFSSVKPGLGVDPK